MTAVLAALLGCGGGCGTGREPRPDVVLIVLDTLRADRLSCYGYERPTSPFLDRLAEQGALFEDVTCQFSWTRPSMVSLFHGRYLTAYRDALEPDVPALSELFQQAGYRTLAFVSNRLVNAKGGFDRGFDHFETPEGTAGPHGRVHWPQLRELAPRVFAVLANELATPERAPILLYVHVMDAHDPYEQHDELDGTLPPEGTEPVLPADWQASAIEGRGAEPPTGSWKAELRQLHRRRGFYDQGVADLSLQLDDFFAGLRERGMLERALVAVVADHGEGLWEHVSPLPPEDRALAPPLKFFYQQHGASQYQEVLATPFLLSGPGVPAAVRISQPVENIDLLPTLLELTGLPAPSGLHGRSLVPLLSGRDSPARPYVFSYGVHGNSVRETASALKLILPLGNSLRAGLGPELYDLERDPHERTNLAAERPDDVRRLTSEWLAWRERYPTEDNLRAASSRASQRDYRRLLHSLGYTELDTGLDTGEDP